MIARHFTTEAAVHRGAFLLPCIGGVCRAFFFRLMGGGIHHHSASRAALLANGLSRGVSFPALFFVWGYKGLRVLLQLPLSSRAGNAGRINVGDCFGRHRFAAGGILYHQPRRKKTMKNLKTFLRFKLAAFMAAFLSVLGLTPSAFAQVTVALTDSFTTTPVITDVTTAIGVYGAVLVGLALGIKAIKWVLALIL